MQSGYLMLDNECLSAGGGGGSGASGTAETGMKRDLAL